MGMTVLSRERYICLGWALRMQGGSRLLTACKVRLLRVFFFDLRGQISADTAVDRRGSQLLAQPLCTLLCWWNFYRYCSCGSTCFFLDMQITDLQKRYKNRSSQHYKNTKANHCVDCGFWMNSMEWELNFKWPCQKRTPQMERHLVWSEVIQPYILQARTPSDYTIMTMEFVQFFQRFMHLNEWLEN